MKLFKWSLLLVFLFRSCPLPACGWAIVDQLKFERGAVRPRVIQSGDGDTVFFGESAMVFIDPRVLARLRLSPGFTPPEGFDWSSPDLASVRSSGDRIFIKRFRPDGTVDTVPIAMESRGLAFYQSSFSPRILSKAALGNSPVLDAACGVEALAVQEMRAQGIRAFGTEVFLSRKARALPYVGLVDSLNPGLRKKQFKYVFEQAGPLYYADLVPFADRAKILANYFRLLQRGGAVVIGSTDLGAIQPLVEYLGLPEAEEHIEPRGQGRFYYYITVTKPWWWIF